MSSVLEIAKKLNKEFQNNKLALVADLTPFYKRLAVRDLGFDFPLYGGLPFGRIITLSGREHSGKTLGAGVILSAYQYACPDKMCAYIDVEHSLDKAFIANMTGLDLTKLLYINPENMSGEQILDLVLELQDAEDIGCIVLDSIPAMESGKELENDIEKDLGRSGNMARPLHKFTKRMADLVSAKNNMFIFINQVRVADKTFTGANVYSEPGGDAPKYYASVKIRFGTRTFTQGDKVDCIDGEKADGFRLKFAITKNKTAPTQRGGGFLTFRYDRGLDWFYDTLEVALKYDFIQRPTSQSYVLVDLNSGEVYKDEEGNDLRFVGKAKVKEYLMTHVDFQVKYLDMLNKYIAASQNVYGSLLDERSLKEINEEESSVEKTQKKKENEEF
jgi:recombination protein RecA